ncbi:MAG TPA: cupin domain-containing protein [Solirubrobacteraceae bacterium]|nr:cupin domain-containing protein [Solirubrobacteraceae bacterium]
MAGVQARDFDSPDETRASEKRRVDAVRMGATTATRFTLEPGWKWSEDVGPAIGSDSCELRHIGVVQSGRLRVAHKDGTEVELAAGDPYVIQPGHDAWVIGKETVQCVEFEVDVN